MPLQISRRGLIGGIAGIIAMPAIVKAESLMRVKALPRVDVITYSFDQSIAWKAYIEHRDYLGMEPIEGLPPVEQLFQWSAYRTEPPLTKAAEALVRGLAAA